MDRRWGRYSLPRRVIAVAGGVLIAVGLIAILVISGSVWWWGLLLSLFVSMLNILFPVALVILLAYSIWAWRRGGFRGVGTVPGSRLHASETDKRIAGVCGGIAEYWHIDSMLVRIIVLMLFAVSPLLMIFVYLVLALAIPRD